jgi:hypothetical protein
MQLNFIIFRKRKAGLQHYGEGFNARTRVHPVSEPALQFDRDEPV